jgi:antirestriction protein
MASVYVGTWNKYNNGSIEGAWIDLDKCATYADFVAKCRQTHKQVVECPSWAEADRIENGFENDPTYKHVNHGYSIPRWSRSRYSWTIRPSSEFTIYK